MPISRQLPGRTLTIDGREWLYFSGTSYLGISCSEVFRAFLLEGIRQYGANFGGSRLSNMQLAVYEEAEQRLAQFVGAEAALTVSSGTLAGQLLLSYLQDRGELHWAPEAHPAIGGRDPSTYEDRQQWISAAHELSNRPGERIILLSNSMDALRVNACPFDWVSQLGDQREIWLVIDDSHGLGVTGNEGGGIYSQIKAPENLRLIVTSSLGKALGVPGGAILGDRDLIRDLPANPLFGGASPVIPAYLYAFLKSGELYRTQLQLLRRNIRQFTQRIGSSGLFRYLPGFPVFYTPKNELAALLAGHQIMVSSFAYPTSDDAPVTRVVLNALHTEEDIRQLSEYIMKMHPQF